MTKSHIVLDEARRDAQELHKKISANIAKAEDATWADVKAVQDDVNALDEKMKALAEDQTEAVKTGIKAAIVKLEAAAKLVENEAVAARDDIRHANAALLDSARRAAQGLSAAVAAARTKVANAIAPGTAPTIIPAKVIA